MPSESQRSSKRASAGPDDTDQLFVVGDVHGCATELEVLVRGLPLGPGDTIVFLGDYVDRGRDSAAVVDFVLGLARGGPAQTICLKGNHEDMFLAFLGYAGAYGEAFLYNGGAATLASYGLARDATAAEAAAALPPDHLAFLQALTLSHLEAPFLFVHAGIDPARPLAEQRTEDLLWIREEFVLRPHALPYTVLFGHTPRRDVLFDLPYKIGLDTGCVYGNRLSCLELHEPRLFQVAAGERRVHVRDVHRELVGTRS
jgi:serine/threonine protein phosphatase 1